MMTEEQKWARKCIRGGFSVLAAIVGAFIGLVFVRWLGWW
jgi:hypothetical protein